MLAAAGLELLVGSYSSIPLALFEERKRCRVIHVQEVVPIEQNGELFFGELSHGRCRWRRSCMIARLLFHGALVFGLVGERLLDERLPFVISVCRGTPL